MSRLNIFLIILLAGMLAFVKIGSASSPDPGVTMALPTATPTPTPIPVADPVNIQIPKIGEDGPVVPTGLDSEGKMLMPENWYENAWYNGPGAVKPGEKGNAVIAGHLDTIFGTKGHFSDLSALEAGDTIVVNSADGRAFQFVVTAKQIYAYDQVPLDTVFGESDEKHLNLITCTGWYNPAQHNYDHRLVVFTKLVE